MKKLSQNVLHNGLLGGCVAVGYMLVLYFVNPKLMFHPVWALMPFLVIFPTFMTLAALADRKDNGGYIKMEVAFKSVFFTAAFSLFLLVAFNFLMKSVVDPKLVGVERQSNIELLENVAEMTEADADDMEEVIAKVEETNMTPHLGNAWVSYILSLMMGTLPGLIIAAAVRRLEPIE
jgi:hypothetical protein